MVIIIIIIIIIIITNNMIVVRTLKGQITVFYNIPSPESSWHWAIVQSLDRQLTQT